MWGDLVGWEELAVLVCAVFAVFDAVLCECCLGEVFEEPDGDEVSCVGEGCSVVFVGEVAGLV